MGTLGELKDRVASDLDRSDIDAAIAIHIARAIEHFASQRFWFTEDRRTTVTVSGNEYATAPTGLRVIDEPDGVWITIGTSRFLLKRQDASLIEDALGTDASSGQPFDYCQVGSQLRFYPKPSAVYTVTVRGIYDLAALSTDSSTNAWTTEAQDLIAARTRYTLCRDKLGWLDEAKAAQVAEAEALQALRRETTKRVGTGRMRPC